jgi:hypothetical protein
MGFVHPAVDHPPSVVVAVRDGPPEPSPDLLFLARMLDVDVDIPFALAEHVAARVRDQRRRRIAENRLHLLACELPMPVGKALPGTYRLDDGQRRPAFDAWADLSERMANTSIGPSHNPPRPFEYDELDWRFGRWRGELHSDLGWRELQSEMHSEHDWTPDWPPVRLPAFGR